jgi:hypothetical protein
MSDTSAFGFGQFVPGFDFLKNLAQSSQQAQAGSASPLSNMGSWVAPTLNIEELDKRIQELKAVQFWLDQNATALKATIQAMEVQKMTLSTLQGMNVNMADLAKAFTASVPVPPAAKAETPPEPAPTASQAPPDAVEQAASTATDGAGKPAVDPMQWWGSLTQQFQNIAASALKDVAAQALKEGPKKATAKAAKSAGAPSATASPRNRAAVKKSATRKTASGTATRKSTARSRS